MWKETIMKTDQELSAEETAKIIELGNCRTHRSAAGASNGRVAVMIEIACDGPIGADIKGCLTRRLEESGHVAVSDDRPDWVFSIIAFHHEDLVEMSVVLRQLFRSTAPGTEMVRESGSDKEALRQGGWVYESLKYHGLHGVPKMALEDFLKSLAHEFTTQRLGRSRSLKMRT
jgi:hypothetical protein